ncbi:DUF2721 domain-containing protein [Roseomonas sp. OT10]|uniref:DUF2721 domain-containing protein n=1 Tax=Roseomonas cutis TaxID=2897332 RepID=UPI001E65191E|nr:DUF2721 domain-containing protein [Roseomonas sp. OT10]UFN48550.1 DUF2721 domain-containing protein [Roseomonas sp. OT10]
MGTLLDFSRAGDVFEIRAIMQAAIAPAFLLTALMGALNMLSARLGRVIDRERAIRAGAAAMSGERQQLARRARAAHRAITACVVAALLICALIVISFAGPFFGLRTGFVLGAILVLALLALMVGLGFFLEEVRLTARYLPREDD